MNKPPVSDEDRNAAMALFEGLSADRIREIGVESLRRAVAARPDNLRVTTHGTLGLGMIEILAPGRTPDEVQRQKEVFLHNSHEEWLRDFVELVWWLVRTGVVVPLLFEENGVPTTLQLTRFGSRFLGEKDDEHPLLPGALKRTTDRCEGLIDEVQVHLTDAHACLVHSLPRPATVLIGLAYEEAIEDIVVELVRTNRLVQSVQSLKAAKKIAAVKSKLSELVPEQGARYRVEAAWDFANTLRDRRNDASHTKPLCDFADSSEIWELFASAVRHLPNLWLTRFGTV